jgi:hypothetical protein
MAESNMQPYQIKAVTIGGAIFAYVLTGQAGNAADAYNGGQIARLVRALSCCRR